MATFGLIVTTLLKMSVLSLVKPLKEALGDKAGINRYGTAFVPMDETLEWQV